MSERFAVEVTRLGAQETALRLHGDLDIAADESLADAYARGSAERPSRVTLDFTDVGYINSTGIALIVRLLAEARRDRREVTAVGLTPHYQEIFRLTRLSDYVTLADTAPTSTELEEASP